MKRRTRLMFITFIIIVCCNPCITGLRILGLFPLEMKSHFMMCERLAKGLAARGHQVDVYSHFPLKKPVPNYTDYNFTTTVFPLTNSLKYDFVLEWKITRTAMKEIFELTGSMVCESMSNSVFQELFERVKKNQPYDVVLIEVSAGNCFLAWGRHLNIPMIGIMTSKLKDWFDEPLGNPYNTAVHPFLWSQYVHPMTFWERLINTITYYDVLLTFKFSMNQQNKYVEKYFGPNYPDASELTKDLDLFLVNTHHSIDGVRAFTPAIIPVGGLHVHDDGTKLSQQVQTWLDDSNDGCVYFSFGSMTRIETFPKEVLDTFYETFKRISPVRVLLKIAKPEELPPNLPSNVLTKFWFPQYQILKHKNIKVFITHGGLMSIQESLSAGIPMIGIPLFSDQFVNTKFQVGRKVAKLVELKSINTDTFTAAIEEVLNDPIYKTNAERFSKDFHDRPMSPLDTATFWIEYIVRHGKQALRSPIVDMPWWKVQLIDVYSFIIFILIVTFYAFILLTKKIISYMRTLSVHERKKDE